MAKIGKSAEIHKKILPPDTERHFQQKNIVRFVFEQFCQVVLKVKSPISCGITAGLRPHQV